MKEASIAVPKVEAGNQWGGVGPGWPDTHDGYCWVCGTEQTFTRSSASVRETYPCPACRGSLRYQAQARAILNVYDSDAQSLKALAERSWFAAQSIYEPGTMGPFRSLLGSYPGYRQSGFWVDARPGETREGVENQDLTRLTYPDDAFDLIISSDIFEHVRHPWKGFAEIWRVLRPGGAHVFTVPAGRPLRKKTVYRVDTTRKNDVHLLPPVYHGATQTEHLVYCDFGQDIVGHLKDIGYAVRLEDFTYLPGVAPATVTFVTIKL